MLMVKKLAVCAGRKSRETRMEVVDPSGLGLSNNLRRCP